MQRIILWAAGLIAMLAALGAPAAAQTRALEVPPTSGWKHARTGVILRSHLAGLQRFELSDFGQEEFDIAARFGDDSTEITVYLFRPALQSVPVWFDRAETAILVRDIYANPTPVAAAQPFAPPRSTVASGLRRVYRPGKSEYASTALAMMPLGEWLVGVRISSHTLDPAQADAKLSEAIAAIGWPEGVAEAPVAAPVAPCAAPLAFSKRARLKPPSMNDALMGAILPAAAVDEAEGGKAKPAGPFCRDPASTAEYGVYREPDEPGGYLMALGDNGRTISIAPALSALIDKVPAFSVLAGDLDGTTTVYPSFTALPAPDRVLPALSKSGPISRSSPGGKEITIGVPAK